MEEEIVIVITPKRSAQRGGSESKFDLHVIGGELTDQQKRQILRALLKDLREE